MFKVNGKEMTLKKYGLKHLGKMLTLFISNKNKKISEKERYEHIEY